jgi:hypothetical protein
VSDFKVPKRSVLAEASLAGQPAQTWELFLSEVAESRAGPERVSDLLNRKSRFVPVKDSAQGHVVVSTKAVLSVSVPAEAEFDDLGAEDLAADMSVTTEIEVILTSGQVLNGTLVYLQPRGQQRLQDFLNAAPPFIAIRQGTQAHVINTEAITSVRTVSSGAS